MSASLMEALQGLVTPAMLKTASSTLGESEGALTSGLGAIVSKLLSALVAGTGDSSLMNTVAGLVASQARDPGALSDVAGLLTGSLPTSTAAIAGNQLIGSLFGVKEGGIAQAAAAAAGLKPLSGASLMALAGPLVLGAMGKAPGASSLTGTALTALLNSERSSLLGAIAPAATAAASAGVAAVKQAASTVAAAPVAATATAAATAVKTATSEAVSATTAQVAAVTGAAAATASAAARTVAAEAIRPVAASPGGSGLSRLLWFIPLLVIGGFGWYVWDTKIAHKAMTPAVEEKKAAPAAAPEPMPEKKAEAPAAAPAPEPAPAVAVDAGNGMLKLALPGGESITYAKDGVESQLINFLQDASSVIDKKTWFNFDRLNFETGSTTLTAESKDQVSNIAAILKSFPTASIKIGGYTDNVGQPESNLKLSDERAKKVMSELEVIGIDAGRLQAEGYGEQFPIADNGTDDGRAKNRRTALSVRAR